jgi:hypothetical protein
MRNILAKLSDHQVDMALYFGFLGAALCASAVVGVIS